MLFQAHFFVLPSPCTTLLREDRLQLGNKNESLLAFHFVLHSPCTIFAPLFKAVLFCYGVYPYISPTNSFPR